MASKFNTSKPKLDIAYLLGLILAVVAVASLSWTPLLFPFRIFTTTLHEASHALVATLTGGKVVGFQVNADGSGLTRTAGGFGFLIASAGYLGSTLFGGLMLRAAKNERGRRRLLYGLTGGLLFILIFFVLNIGNLLTLGIQRDPVTFGLIGLVALLFGFMAYKGPNFLVTLFVYTTALLSTCYAVLDLVNLVFLSTKSSGLTDARNLQSYTQIPALVWAILWSLLAGFILWQTFRSIILKQTGGNKPRPAAPPPAAHSSSAPAPKH